MSVNTIENLERALEIRQDVDKIIRQLANEVGINLYKDDQPTMQLQKMKHYLVKIHSLSSIRLFDIERLEEYYHLFKKECINYIDNFYK